MTWDFKGIEANLKHRVSVVLAFRYLRIPEPRTIYAPARHEKVIRGLYASLGARHRFEQTANGPAQPAQTILETEIAPVENRANIQLVQAGEDLDAALPFFLAMVACVVILILFPQTAPLLPGLR